MENNALIRIKTLQTSDEGDMDPIELETQGIFGIINKKYYIKYQESAMTGFPDTITTLKIWPDNVTVTRKGKFNMKLHYESGKRNLCLYPTPYGEIAASIQTYNVEYQFGENGGDLRVDYTLDADNENFVNNSLRVNVQYL